MAVDKVNVVNVALRLIGATRIVKLTDDSTAAINANDIYDDLVDDLLRQHFWNFATSRAKLSQLTPTPEFKFDHAYALPNDWIRTVSVHPDSDGRSTTIYKEELVNGQKVIVTDADEVYMRYIKRITDPNLWAADFRRAVSTALARDLAIALGRSNRLSERMEKTAMRDLARARSTDAMGSSPEQRPRGSWSTRRGSGARRAEPGTIDGV